MKHFFWLNQNAQRCTYSQWNWNWCISNRFWNHRTPPFLKLDCHSDRQCRVDPRMTKFSSLATSKVVILTISDAANDDNFTKMTIFSLTADDQDRRTLQLQALTRALISVPEPGKCHYKITGNFVGKPIFYHGTETSLSFTVSSQIQQHNVIFHVKFVYQRPPVSPFWQCFVLLLQIT